MIQHRNDTLQECEGLSGRVFISTAIVVILLLWGSLFLAFRVWREHYRERAAFGAKVLAPAIDSISSTVPPGLEPETWLEAVDQTHDMLAAVSGSNLLGRDQMAALGDQLRERAMASRPETAVETLTEIWNEMESRAGPVVTEHHPRPKILARKAEPENR